jgi:hypothetical protein
MEDEKYVNNTAKNPQDQLYAHKISEVIKWGEKAN